MTMVFRYKPVTPMRGFVQHWRPISENDTLADVLDWAIKLGGRAQDITVENLHREYSSPDYVCSIPESDAQFKAKWDLYEKELAEYEVWEKENKDWIAARAVQIKAVEDARRHLDECSKKLNELLNRKS